MTDGAASMRSMTAVDRVASVLKEGVREGRYAPGQRLVESDLTAELGVSRGPLREALWRLSAEGIVAMEPNRGAVVRRMSRDDVQSVYEIREMLEGLAARLAAGRLSGSDPKRASARLEKSLERQRALAAGDVYGYVQENVAFHRLIVELSGNPRLAGLIEQLQLPLSRLQLRGFLQPAATQTSLVEHELLAEAVLSGNTSAAEERMREHIRASGALIQSLPDSAFT